MRFYALGFAIYIEKVFRHELFVDPLRKLVGRRRDLQHLTRDRVFDSVVLIFQIFLPKSVLIIRNHLHGAVLVELVLLDFGDAAHKAFDFHIAPVVDRCVAVIVVILPIDLQ